MLDFKEILGNKWVLGGGLALGLVVLLVAGKSGSSAPAGAYDPNTVLGLGELQAQQNAAGLNYSENLAQIAAGTQANNEAAQTTRSLKILDLLDNIQQGFTQTSIQSIVSNAGIANSRIQANAALALDQQQEQTRLATSYVSADVSKYGIAADVTKTRIATAAQEDKYNLDAANQSLATVLGFAGKFVGA